MKMWRIQIILTLTACFVTSSLGSGSHSLVFLSSGLVKPQAGHYFEQLTVFDGVIVSYCDSLTRIEQFKSRLQNKHLKKDCEEAYVEILESIHNIQVYTNNTVDVVQRRRGCSQSADGTVSGFEAWAVNGMAFLTFDPDTLKWMSDSPLALRVEKLWLGQPARNYVLRAFIKYFCPNIIQQITIKAISKKTELRVFAKAIDDTDKAQLRCHVTTTDTSVKSVQLIGDGATRVSGISVIGPLPSGDGSVIFRLTAWISLSDSSLTYGCALQSEGHNITIYWDGNTVDGKYIYPSKTYKSVYAIIVGFISLIVLIIVISCTIICLQKCVKMRRPAPPPPRPELTVQFESFIQSSSLYPDIRNILLSYLYGPNTPDKYRDSYEQWLEMLQCTNYYDPDFYGGRV